MKFIEKLLKIQTTKKSNSNQVFDLLFQEEIKIIDCKVFVNPYDDVDQQASNNLSHTLSPLSLLNAIKYLFFYAYYSTWKLFK